MTVNPLATFEIGSTAAHHTLLMQVKSSKLIVLPVSNIKAKLHWIQQKVPEYLHTVHICTIWPQQKAFKIHTNGFTGRQPFYKRHPVFVISMQNRCRLAFFWPPLILPRLASLIYILLFFPPNATTCPLRLCAPPPSCGWSVTDFWGWDAQ